MHVPLRRDPPNLPAVADVLKHPAFPTATWNLEPDREGLLSVAEGRGGPFKISWEIHGEGPVKIMLIMGLGSLKSAWQRQTFYFGHQHRDRYSVLVMDNRGMGASDKPLLRYSTSEMAQDCVEVLRHVEWLTPASASVRWLHLAGISLGGMISQEVACLLPQALSSYSLCCSAAAIENTTTFSENVAQRASMLLPKSVERSVHNTGLQLFPAAWLTQPDEVDLPDPQRDPKVAPPGPGLDAYLRFGTNYERYVAQEMHKRLDARAFGLKGFLLQLVAAGWHRKTAEQLRALADAIGRERILVMHGTEDGMISVPHGRKLVEYLNPGTALIVEGMGHAPIIERSKWFNEVLEKNVENGERLDGRV